MAGENRTGRLTRIGKLGLGVPGDCGQRHGEGGHDRRADVGAADASGSPAARRWRRMRCRTCVVAVNSRCGRGDIPVVRSNVHMRTERARRDLSSGRRPPARGLLRPPAVFATASRKQRNRDCSHGSVRERSRRAGFPGLPLGKVVLHCHGFDWRRLCATLPGRRLERRAGTSE